MELVRRSSSIGKAMFHLCFKVKYCKKIFDNKTIEQRCRQLLCEAASSNDIEVYEIGFDRDHVHMVADIGLHSIPEVAKLLKGYSGHKLLEEYHWMKMQYFWGSGFWSPATFFESIGKDYGFVADYVRNQGNTASL